MKNYSLIIFFCLLITSNVIAQDVAKLDWGLTTSGGQNDYERASVLSSEKDPFGNTIIFGHFGYTGDFDPGPGVFQLVAPNDGWAYILKLDPNGNFLWAGSLGKATQWEAHAMTVDKDGNILITGNFGGTMDMDPGPGVVNVTSEHSNNLYVLKLTNAGAFVWVKQSSATTGYDIDTDAAGDIFVMGTISTSSAEVDPGPGNIFLTHTGAFVWKITAAGNYGWAARFRNTTYLSVDAAGDVLLAGQFSNTISIPTGSTPATHTAVSSSDVVVGKLRGSDGAYVWSGQMGGVNGTEVSAVTSDASNNFYVAGLFNGAGAGDFDPSAGVINVNGSASFRSGFVAKINSSGAGVFAKGVTGSGDVWPFSLATDNTDVYVGGRFKGTADFNPGAGVDNQTSGTGIDSYVLRLKASDGEFIWAATMGKGTNAGSESSTNGLVVTAPGEIIASGAYRNKIDADPGPCIRIVDSGDGGYDVYIVKLITGPPLPVPTLTSVTPLTGPIGTPITITGTNFGPGPTDNTVVFNATPATITSNTTTTINTSVPNGGSSGTIKVTAYCTTLTTAVFNVTGNPIITSISPTNGPIGTVVTVNGSGFSTTPSNNIVKFNGVDAVVTSSTAIRITTSVPVGATSGKISVTVGVAPTAISGQNFIVTAPAVPTISSFSPASGPEETLVAINGTNFSPTPSINAVKFNGVAATVVSSTTTRINVTVPTGATTGKITVTIGANTATSATDFTVTPPGATITITQQPQDVEGCGNSVTFTTAATGTTNIQYQWQYSFDTNDPNYTNLTNGNGISGVTTPTLTIGATPTNEGLYRCFITGDNASSKRTNGALFTSTGCSNPPPPVIETEQLETVAGGIITIDLTPLITTDDEIVELLVVTPPASGATASIAAGILTIDYTGISFSGSEEITIVACDNFEQCTEQTFSIEVSSTGGELVVYNGLSPGGANPTLIIANIDLIAETKANSVTVFDRWQNPVWTGTDYNNDSVVFKGVSSDGKDLPTGTYFYRIQFTSGRKEMTGFISLKR